MPVSHTRPRSLRPRSTSITCSAFSFSSPTSSRSSAASASGVAPRGRVPAIGQVEQVRPESFTSSSGDDPISVRGPTFMKKLYGEGFTTRSAR